MKETNVEYRPLHAHTASFALGFEIRSKELALELWRIASIHELPRGGEPVEKVGVELIATTKRA
jgi:hypothetical protein